MNPLLGSNPQPDPTRASLLELASGTTPEEAQRRAQRIIADQHLTPEQVEWAKRQAMGLGKRLGLIR